MKERRMAKNVQVQVRGVLHWAKIVGAPRLNTFTEEKEWSVDITPNAASLKALKDAGVADKLKEPKDGDTRKDKFLTLRQRATRTDKVTGEIINNYPPKINKASGTEWPEGVLIGNGTVADVLVTVVDNGKGKPKGTYIGGIRILDHVPYEGGPFKPLSEDDEYFQRDEPAESLKEASKTVVNPTDLDDEIPF